MSTDILKDCFFCIPDSLRFIGVFGRIAFDFLPVLFESNEQSTKNEKTSFSYHPLVVVIVS
jgi:hypothetical protein